MVRQAVYLKNVLINGPPGGAHLKEKTMDELIKTMLEQLPNVGGLLLAVAILYRQNEKFFGLLDERLESLEARIAEIEKQSK